MALKIIDNKRIDVTPDEFKMYQAICNGYAQGKDLFQDLFETDEEGIIVYLKPPKKQFSMEVVLFLQNLMVHQHLRKIYKEHNEALAELKQVISDAKKTIAEAK